jgi:hypothetical protein
MSAQWEQAREAEWTKEQAIEYEESRKQFIKRREQYSKERRLRYARLRARATAKRLYSNRMSLCPYFRAVVLAVLVYYLFVKPGKGLRNRFGYLGPRISQVAAVTTFVAIFAVPAGLILYYNGRDLAEGIVNIPSSVAQEYRQRQAEKQFWAELEQKREKEAAEVRQRQMEYDLAHPEEVQKRNEFLAAESKKQALLAQRESERWWNEEFPQIIVGSLAFIGGLSLFAGLIFLGAKALDAIEKWLKGLADRIKLPGEGEAGPLLTLVRRIVQRYRLIRDRVIQIAHDTWELVAEFAKAKHEKVCPFLNIVNGENH